MNHLFLEEMERNVEGLGDISGRRVILFGANKTSEFLIRILRGRKMPVSAVIDNDAGRAGTTFQGIPVGLPADVLDGRGDILVLIASRYFTEMKRQCMELGVDGGRIVQAVAFRKLSTSEEAFHGAEGCIRHGKEVYEGLEERYGRDIFVGICPYPGIGDMYLVCAYWESFCERHVDGKGLRPVLTCVGKGCGRIAGMFGYSDVCQLDQRSSDDLSRYTSFLPDAFPNVQVFTHNQLHWDILARFEHAGRTDWGTIFKDMLLRLDGARPKVPGCDGRQRAEAGRLLSGAGLAVGRTAILSPYANTLPCLPDGFWTEATERLKERGYSVCTNVGGEGEGALPGTVSFRFPLELAQAVVEKAGMFIGLRSGLCDVVSGADAEVFVLYPDEKAMFFNLKSMGLGRNVREMVYGEFLEIIPKSLSETWGGADENTCGFTS